MFPTIFLSLLSVIPAPITYHEIVVERAEINRVFDWNESFTELIHTHSVLVLWDNEEIVGAIVHPEMGGMIVNGNRISFDNTTEKMKHTFSNNVYVCELGIYRTNSFRENSTRIHKWMWGSKN